MKVHLISLTLGLSSFALSVYSLAVRSEADFQPESLKREIRPSQADDTRTFLNTYSHSHVQFENTKRNILSNPSTPGLSKRAKDYWTTEEDNLLLDLRAQGRSWEDIAEAFSRRTPGAAEGRYYTLKRKLSMQNEERIPWTPEEDKLLQDLRARGQPWKEISKAFPERTQQAVKIRYGRISKKQWTSKEDERLQELARSGLNWEEIAERLPGRSPVAISRRYRLLGGDNKAQEDKFMIQAIEEGETYKEISRVLGISEHTAWRRASKLEKLGRIKLPSKSKKHRYTDADVELIHMMREDNVSWTEISKRFPERSKSAIQQLYSKYKLRKEEEEKAQKEEEDDT